MRFDVDALGLRGWAMAWGLWVVLSGPLPAFGQCDDVTPPAPVADLAASSPTSNSVVLGWTATGDDGSGGTAFAYDVRVASGAVTLDDTNWASATQVAGAPTPATAGTPQAMVASGLAPGLPWSFAIRAIDEAGNVSAVSNTAVGTTHATQSLVLRPVGRGTYTQWGETFPGVGADHWQNVDEVTADDAATYVFDNSWNGTEIDTYVHPASGIPPGSPVNNVQVCLRARQTDVNGVLENNGIRIFIRSGSTDAAFLATSQLPNAWTAYCRTWTTDPATGGAWTVAAVDALQIGARNAMSSGGPDGVQLTAAWMVVSYQGEPRLPAKIIRTIAIDPVFANGTRLHENCTNWKTPKQAADEYVGGLNAALGQPVYTYSIVYTVDVPLASAAQTVPCAGQRKYTGFTPAHMTGEQFKATYGCGSGPNLAWNLPGMLNAYASDAERNADAFHEVLLLAPPTGGEFEGCMVCSPNDPYCYPAHDRILERSGLAYAVPPSGKRYVIHGFNFLGYQNGTGVTEQFLHRSEAIFAQVFSATAPGVCTRGHWDLHRPDEAETPWELLTLYDRQFPGEGHLGHAHDPANSPGEYIRSSLNQVPSGAALWNGYPVNFPLDLALDERRRHTVSCASWACSADESFPNDYLRWWVARLPRHGTGKYGSRYTDWRRYLIDVNVQDGRGLPITAPTVGPAKGARNLRLEVRDTVLGGDCTADTPRTPTVVLSWTRERSSAGTFEVQQSVPGTGVWQTITTLGGTVETHDLGSYPTQDTNYRVLWNAPGGGAFASDVLGIRVGWGSPANRVGNFSLALHQSTQATARWTRGAAHCTNYGDMRYTLYEVSGSTVAVGSVDRTNLAGSHYMYRHETGVLPKVYTVYAYDLQNGTPVVLSASDRLVAMPNESGVDGH